MSSSDLVFTAKETKYIVYEIITKNSSLKMSKVYPTIYTTESVICIKLKCNNRQLLN